MSEQALTALRQRYAPLRVVIFDCDGVIIDSETIATRVVARALAELGWVITPEEAHRRFLGMRLPDMVPMIETVLGRELPAGWPDHVGEQLVIAMTREAVLMPGAAAALDAADALGLHWRIASNSGPRQLAAKFLATGLTDRVSGRVVAAADIVARGGRGKPAPDIFLAAAEQTGHAPGLCLVIEDSPLGVRGAVAAGMQCLGLDEQGDGAHLAIEGAVPFRSMHDLPGLLKVACGVAA